MPAEPVERKTRETWSPLLRKGGEDRLMQRNVPAATGSEKSAALLDREARMVPSGTFPLTPCTSTMRSPASQPSGNQTSVSQPVAPTVHTCASF